MASSGADVLELDHLVDLREACRVVGPDIALWGNLDPVRLLAQWTESFSTPSVVRVWQAAWAKMTARWASRGGFWYARR